MKSLSALIVAVGVYGMVASAQANTSPYATTTSNTSLNQSSTDDINGLLTASTHTPTVGSLSSLTDATSSFSPGDSVIVGPDDATVKLSWDFGTEMSASARQLQTVSIWIAADNQRNGFNGSLETSLDGITFTPIADSAHNVNFTAPISSGLPANFHHILYDFSGTNVSNFRFLQLNSSGYAFTIGDPTFQPRFVEIDVVVVPEPSTVALLALGAGFLGFSVYRKNRKSAV